MRPIIGVPLRYQKLEDGRNILFLGERVRRTLQTAGGYVLPLSPVQDVDYFNTKGNEFLELTDIEKEMIEYGLDLVDGILFPGGIKFTPYDRYLLKRVIERKIPVLGICLGMQLMSCYDDEVLLEKNNSIINHKQEVDEGFTHKVTIDKDSKLYEIFGKEQMLVNSFHNYHVTENNFYITTVLSEDGLIEGIEFPGDTFNIGVQWHPEISYNFDDDSRKIIDAFIEAARIYHKSKDRLRNRVNN